MTSLGDGLAASRGQWTWPLDVTCYDREPTFSPEERQALLLFLKMKHITQEDVLKILAGVTTLERIVRPGKLTEGLTDFALKGGNLH